MRAIATVALVDAALFVAVHVVQASAVSSLVLVPCALERVRLESVLADRFRVSEPALPGDAYYVLVQLAPGDAYYALV